VTTGTVTDTCLDQTITANTNAVPGSRTLSCSFGTNGTYSTSLSIYDVTPRIDSMNPNPIPYPGTTPVTITGVGFGNAPPTLQFTPGGVTVVIEPGNSPTQFTADMPELAVGTDHYSRGSSDTNNRSGESRTAKQGKAK
jgi:IPT/TIG domain